MFLPSFRARCRAAANENPVRAERVIAVGRAFVATTAFLAIYADPLEPAQQASLTYALLGAYSAGSVAFMLAIKACNRIPQIVPLVAHAADVAIAASLTLFSGLNSPFFVFFVYALLAAAYRWGFYATALTAVTASALVVGQAALIPGDQAAAAATLEWNRVVIRTTYLLIMAGLAGYLGEKERVRRLESDIASVVARRAQETSGGTYGVIQAVFGPVLALFAARGALVVTRNRRRRCLLWRIEPGDASERVSISVSPLTRDDEARYLVGQRPHAWWVARRRLYPDVVHVDAGGVRLPPTPRRADAALLRAHAAQAILSVPIETTGRVYGRVFLLDPEVGFECETALLLAQRLARELAVATGSAHRLRRVRSTAERMERGRLARDLHDGVVQSLAATDLRLERIRRIIEPLEPRAASDLASIQAWCRDEARALRLLTRGMQAPGGRGAGEELTDVVERFRRESGIATEYVADYRRHGLSARTRREVARIVQEALRNVTKHSGAGHVRVHASTVNGRWKVSVEDDGRGFPSTAMQPGDEPGVAEPAPYVIRERVRAMRGFVSVESTPGKGCRLEVDVPIRG